MASEHGSTSVQHNQRTLLREILLGDAVPRQALAARTQLSAGAVSRLVRPLIDAGLVRERTERPGEHPVRPGRRFQPLEIDPRGGQVLAIGVTPVLQTVALADIGREVIAGTNFSFEPVGDADQVIHYLAKESRKLIGTHLANRQRLLGGLLIVTGVVDPVRGNIVQCPYLRWGPVEVRATLGKLLNLPMQVRSLTPAIARAEMLFGAARGHQNALGMICGQGVGATVIIDGRPVADGPFPTSGIGMMRMVGEDGTTSTLDDLAGGLGILWRLHGEYPKLEPLSHSNAALEEAIRRDAAGDPQAARQMARAGRELGRALVQHAHFVRPDVVLIAGVLALAPSYMAGIRETVDEGMVPPVKVLRSRVTDVPGGWWASCSMAVYEYLTQQPLDLSRLGALMD